MSSKPPEETEAGRSPVRGLSITGKLTLLNTLSAFGILLVAMLFQFLALSRELAQEDRKLLADEIAEIRAILSEDPIDIATLEREIRRETAPQRTLQFYSRVLDEHGGILMETPTMASVLPGHAFPVPEEGGLGANRAELRWFSAAGMSFRLQSARADGSPEKRKLFLVQVALDVSDEQRVLSDYRKKMVLVLLSGIVLSAMLSAIVAHRGLRPLREIARTAGRITVTRLGERLSITQWPAELSDLAMSFNRMMDRLEDGFERLSRFSDDLAHELRTPINNLMGEAEVALSRSRTPEEYRQVLESALEEHGKLSRMIDSILFLARPEPRIDRVPVDTRREVEALLEYYGALAEEKTIRTSCRGEVTAVADPLLFRRAVGNLLSNAIRYTPPGGGIDVELRQGADGAAVIAVRDDGIGIEPNLLPKICERFSRSEAARSVYPQGMGLGLAIVKSIMDLHGGTIEISSELGKGACAVLVFPLRQAKHPKSRES
ncbi:MAG: heavy metal sensor histidine kinase [Deltaproteobacteria bacterium]|nr:heavy metal sensor histidine kinase [Candidatus Deferrimicrobium borealis]